MAQIKVRRYRGQIYDVVRKDVLVENIKDYSSRSD